MSETKRPKRSGPLSIKGFTFEEAVAELLKHKLPKEEKRPKAKPTKSSKVKH